MFMTISNELEAKILRHYHVEKWKVGTIARQLTVHHSVVKRVLSQAGIAKENFTKKESIITTFLPFILETLRKYPKLTASRLYHMVNERGYNGSQDHFRHLITLYRPRPPAEAYLRLRTLPGEQGQVDWGHFGYIDIGKARRPLMAFVIVLSYSRKIFLRFYLDARMANFLRGHEAAFNAWNGVPRVCLYDNLKSAVLERQGDAIRFHPTLLEFAGHYRYEPRPVAVARGNEKGRVERAIRYVRDNFFAARTWKNIDDLNDQAIEWCDGPAANRPCPEDKAKRVSEVFIEEQPRLLKLPDNPYPADEREDVNVGKTPYIRFDLNDYSVPHEHVRRILTVSATLNKVFILDGIRIVAEHGRSYEKGKQIETESHIKELVDFKKQARKHRSQDRLIQAVPISQTLLIQAAERGYSLGVITADLLRLLDRYGSNEMEAAVTEALARGVPHPNSVRLSLEKRREERDQPPPINIDLPDDERVRGLVVRPHDLNQYDLLQSITEEKKDDNEK
jgi:transposase